MIRFNYKFFHKIIIKFVFTYIDLCPFFSNRAFSLPCEEDKSKQDVDCARTPLKGNEPLITTDSLASMVSNSSRLLSILF